MLLGLALGTFLGIQERYFVGVSLVTLGDLVTGPGEGSLIGSLMEITLG